MPRGSGRRPKPTALKELQGNPGGRKLNRDEPKPDVRRPDMPPELAEIPAAVLEWERIIPELEAMKVLTVADRAAAAAYCFSYAVWWDAYKEVQARGILIDEPVTDKDGNEIGTRTKKNPACTEVATQLRIMRSYLVEFGLTPSSRSRLRVEGKKDDKPSPLAELLMRRSANTNALPN